jgi:hypothetical protein
MANDSVTLFLEGSPTLDDYTAALSSLQELLQAIAAEVAGSASIEWRLEALEASSALTQVRGVSDDMGAVENVTDSYLEVGRQLYAGGQLRPQYSRPAERIVGLLNPNVIAVRFETDRDDVTLSIGDGELAKIIAMPRRQGAPQGQPGTVEGRIETMSRRGGLRFVLFDLVYDKAVTCYLQAGQEDLMLGSWGKLAVVEGIVKRDPVSGRPTTVRQVSSLRVVSETEPGKWKQARGVLPASEERAEDAIRRIRDA